MSVSTFTGNGALGLASVSATTGSPTIDTTSRPGKTIYKFTGSGSITIGAAGFAEVLVVGGGGGAVTDGGPGAGAGGYIYSASKYLPSGSQTITVGAGGAGIASGSNGPANCGEDTTFYDMYAIGGGGAVNTAGVYAPYNNKGGSGGGGRYNASYTLGVNGQGYRGGSGNGSTYISGGGGGAGGVGSDGGASEGVGGPGIANSITGTAVTYAVGGTCSYSGMVGATNTGGGGGGSRIANSPSLVNGGSGIVVVVIG